MRSIENKLAKIEVFITDIDGSVKKDRVRTKVVDGKLEIIRSPFNEELIEGILRIKKKGIQFGVASGWGFDAIQYYFKKQTDVIIAENGGVIESKGTLHMPNSIYGIDWNSKVEERRRIAEKHESFPHKIYPHRVGSRCKLGYFHPIHDYEEFKQMCSKNIEGEWVARTFKQETHMHVDYLLPYFNKKDGLKFYFEKTGIDPSKVAYLGDHNNDRKVFQWNEIGLKIAPETAIDEIRKMADLIIESPPYGAIKLLHKLG